MNEIIALLEKADGPDRKIDGEIAKARGWTYQKWPGDSKPYWRKPGTKYYYIREKEGPPPYTNSMDAAVSLVPVGMYWMAAFGKLRSNEPIGACQIFHPDDSTVPTGEAEGQSVHIAICIAALRAMTDKTAEG